ncbi:hypothetical protein CIB95_13335 [Lottiidibacillus patelloidae]|uniref:Uncharacterized protein n=1 Tax=Lottiidibacillus patelloidae TaxID=2670334 RepID=A0A263BSC1_9BACI|nr:hypothetical protein [Lottiidibacillus patelloidae]OZM56086.1 hypothetical protein CIB95_13335 [Lottiidibacillus patelloidae]
MNHLVAFRSVVITSTLFILLLLVAIQPVPELKAVTTARDYVDVIFKGERKGANTVVDEMEFYLPTGMVIEGELEFNTILEQNGQWFILFYNPQEKQYSRSLFKAAMRDREKYILVHSFKTNNKFGYLHVMQLNENDYEIVVSVGKVKMTTKTTTNEMTNSVKQMSEIVHSVTFNN